MDHWPTVFLNLLSQFTGGRGGIDHVIVHYGIAALLYAILFRVAFVKHQTCPKPREHLLRWGFGFALGRELFMLGMAVIQALGLTDPAKLHSIFPPFEHLLINIALVLISAAVLNYLLNDEGLARRFLRIGLAGSVASYLVTFWLWPLALAANPALVFGKTWYDVLWHVNGSVWPALAAGILAVRTPRGKVRNLVLTALTLYFLYQFLKLPDIAFNEVYEKIIAPIRVSLYLIAIMVLGYLYIYEQSLERDHDLQQLAESRKLLQVTLDSIGDAVITTDMHGHVVWLNPVAERLTGWLKADARGLPIEKIFVIVNEDTRTTVENPVAACIEHGKIVGLANGTMLISRDGTEYDIADSAAPIRQAEDSLHGVVLVFHDVTEQRRLGRELSHRARHDALTGLVNRAEFESQIGRLIERIKHAPSDNALLYIDLDQFKLVNDACGHSVGDEFLRQVSTLLQTCMRGRDTVARLGGDEFGAIFEHCDMDDALKIAQKICDKMDEFRFVFEGRGFRVGASIGLVPLDDRWKNTAAVMQAADMACYAAKESGRNRVHRWFETDRAINERKGAMQWVTRLEQALDEDRFELWGQRIESNTHATKDLHCEILLRLRDADGNIFLPATFLLAAERFNMASRIDRWVVHKVFSWLERVQDGATPIGLVAINLSGHSIGDRSFHRYIVGMLQSATFDVSKLCFEITETAAIASMGDARAFIDEVRALGVKIALDDFGSGASSFGYLKSLPVDYLKIDGQFITGLLDDQLDQAAVRSFREVAKVVGIRTIAEYVENEEVRDALREIGIDMVQGNLIHVPEPLELLLPELAAEV